MKCLKLSGKKQLMIKVKVAYQLENGVEGIIFDMVNSTIGKESLEKKP